jgi:putative transposase
MQQLLDRRQPSARLRPQLREIPLQRRRGTAANGENDRQRTPGEDRPRPASSSATAPRNLPPRPRDDRGTGDPLRGGGVVSGAANALDAATGQDIEAETAATTGLEVLQEPDPKLVDPRLMAAVVCRVEPAAAPAAEPREGTGQPAETPDVSREGQDGRPVDPSGSEVLVRPSALSAGTGRGDAGRVNQPVVDVAADQVAAGDLVSMDLPEVSDLAWEWMAPLLPSSMGRRGGRWRDHRQVVEAICWKYRTGSPWRDLPARFGPWQTAYERQIRWGSDGTWARLLARAQADAGVSGELDWLAAVASTVVRMHQHGASSRRVGDEAAAASPGDAADGAAA